MVLWCTAKEKMQIRVIEARVKDDGDYDYIHDNAMHNTLRKYFKWAEESGAKISFEKSFEDIGYTLTLCVDAIFEDKEDYALFKLTFSEMPFTRLNITPDMEGYFVNE